MDKGACNFATSEIQTWLLSTIESFINILIRMKMHTQVCHVTGTTEMKLLE